MLDLLIVLAFVVYATTAGLRARRKASQGLNEYFLAGQTISGWRAGLSMAATQFAADTPLLVMGLIATGGVFLLWRLWIYGLAFLLMAFVFAVGWRRAGVLTDAELTEVRYSGRGVLPLRVLKAVYYGTLINCVVMAMVLVAAMRIAEVFLPWHDWLPEGVYGGLLAVVSATGLSVGASVTGLAPEVMTANSLLSILLILAFTGLYSATGGLRAVIATDVAQLGLALGGTAVFAWVAVRQAGGLAGLPDAVAGLYGADEAARLLSFGPPELGAGVLLPFLTIVGLQWFFQMNADGTGYLAQRSMACRTDRDARQAGVIFAWTQILLRSLIWLVIGVALLVVYPFTTADAADPAFAASREILFVTGINDLLPVGLRGLMLTGLLAALASTIDTHLNWGASYWSNDVYGRLVAAHWQGREPSQRELVVVARLSNVLLLALALLIMANLGSIQEAWVTSLLLGAGMGSVLVLRWLWERINLWSEVAAIAVSLVVAPVLLFGFGLGDAPGEDALRLAAMALASTAAAVGVTFVTPRTSDATLARFYGRVRPVGAWRRTAALAGDDPARPAAALRRRLGLTALTAGSLFLLLVGLGRVLIPPPAASALVTGGLVLAGLALIPLWWRGAFLEEHLEPLAFEPKRAE
jgi:solute:Na+ symporter, SSS family